MSVKTCLGWGKGKAPCRTQKSVLHGSFLAMKSEIGGRLKIIFFIGGLQYAEK
jgi:hypothetical protein